MLIIMAHLHYYENQMQLHYSTLFNNNTTNNKNEMLCMNITEDQA